jgi:hypothetical protein
MRRWPAVARKAGWTRYRRSRASPFLFVLAVHVTACGTAPASTDPASLDCALPWESIEQVQGCGDADVRMLSMSGARVDIAVRPKNADRIARALAGAFVQHGAMADEMVIWAWSKTSAIHSGAYDRGRVSEEGGGDSLMFEICTAWKPAPGPVDLCTDKLEFIVAR